MDHFDVARTLITCLCMAGLAALVLWRARVPLSWEPIVAVLRAGVQLVLLALILSFLLTDASWILLWLGVMYLVAVFTSAQRIALTPRVVAAVAAGIGGGVLAALGIAFLSDTVEFGAQYLLATGGIVIGNTMNASTLTVKRLQEQLAEHRGEVEGWLSLGATPRQAAARFRAAASRLALTPTIDQTKTTGIVTLPGAFTGAVFAGASPLDAGLFQLVVLSGAILGSAICSITVAALLGAPKQVPAIG